MTVLVLFNGVALTGLPVASTGLLEVAAEEVPAVLERLGAMLPELPWPVLPVELVPTERRPAGAVPAGVVCACAVELSVPTIVKAIKKSFLLTAVT